MHPFVHLFGRDIPMYWLCGVVGLALAAGLALLRRRGGRCSVSADDLIHTMLLCVIGALAGAKIFQVIGLVALYASQPGFWTAENWLAIGSSGGVFYGGLIGAFAAAVLYMRKYKVNFRDMTDLLVPSVLLFHAFGRLGCFFAGCCYGCEAPWGIEFSHSLSAPNGVPLAPVQLFEAGFNLLFMSALLLLRPERKRPGALLPVYLMDYAVARFVLEFFRGDASRGVFVLSTSQWISLVLLPAAVVLLLKTPSRSSRSTQAAGTSAERS